MNPEKRKEIFARLKKGNPNPQTELEYDSHYELLISVLLSAQATDVSVNLATRKLYKVANTPAAMVKLGEPRVRNYIKTIGLFNTKAKNVIKASQQLLDLHGGVVPENREALEALPGVGRKTANVVLNTAFRQPAMAVDTHIFRVSNRTGIAKGKDVVEVEKKLLRHVPKEYLLDAHHWLILHGRYVCVARKPRCADCVIRDLCDFREKTG
jgi:endonuclease-3